MENLDRTNFMPYNMYQFNGECMTKGSQMNMEQQMPPYMYGKCNSMCNPMCNTQQNIMPNMYMCPNNCRGGYNTYAMEPIENLCGKHYKMLMVYVNKSMTKIVTENMGMMPKYISKDKFNIEVNAMMCEVIKHEKEIKQVVVEKREETEEIEDREFCPYCNGFLKGTLEIIFVMELLRNGCAFCY